MTGRAHPSPGVPMVPGDPTSEIHYRQHDLLRRVCDLLIGDWIVIDGEVREVFKVGLIRHKPGEAYLGLVGDREHPDLPGKTLLRTYRADTLVRVVRSTWQAPTGEYTTGSSLAPQDDEQ